MEWVAKGVGVGATMSPVAKSGLRRGKAQTCLLHERTSGAEDEASWLFAVRDGEDACVDRAEVWKQ